MNAFYEHHKDNIRFGYRCFDRLLLSGTIQSFQQPERVLGFFNALPRRQAGNQTVPGGHRRPVPELGEESGHEMGSAYTGRPGREAER